MIHHDLSFHYDQPWFRHAGLRLAFQIFTGDNLFGLDPARVKVESRTNGLRVTCSGLTWAGGQEKVAGGLECVLEGDGRPLVLNVRAVHRHPIKAVKVQMEGLEPGALTWLGEIAAAGAQPGAARLRPGQDRLVSFPGWTPGEMALLHTDRSCAAFASRDEAARPTRVYATHRLESFRVELVFEQGADRRETEVQVPPWWVHLDTTPEAAIRDYAAWLEALDGLLPWDRRPDVPDWARQIRLVVNLHGEHWTGYVFNTFERMLESLQTLNHWLPARHILAYLPGFSGRYYRHYPNFRPGGRLGGPTGFRRLVEGARALGCRVMPMFGAHGAHLDSYPAWQQAVVRDSEDVAVERLNQPDWDSDRAGEARQVFLNLGEAEFRAHLTGQVSRLLEDYQLEAAFFDTLSWRPNDARHDMWTGVRALMEGLRARFPQVLWTCEGAHARLLRYFPLVQLRLAQGQRFRYPGFVYRYIRVFDHLSTGAPGLGSSGVHERGFHGFHLPEPRPGHIPALSVVADTLTRYREVARRVCELAGAGG